MAQQNDPNDYFHLPLTKADLASSPILQFNQWLEQAKSKGEIEPTAMTLATTDKDYHVTARMVLLKSVDEKGFVFFTNYLSLKAKQLKEIPQAALVFWWPLCQRQVRITGTIGLTSAAESDTYFRQRSNESQIASAVSLQSSVIRDRQSLIEKYDALSKQTAKPLERPDFWGGYILYPLTLEFWQGREHRLHDRFLYTRNNQQWDIVQLSP